MNKNILEKTGPKAVAYLRTSSATNIGEDKDSEHRQRIAIESFARSNGYVLAGEYYDQAVSGTDPVNERPGFIEMLDRVATNGAKIIIIESPDRFARDLMVQIVGYNLLKNLGIQLISTSSPDYFTQDTPTADLIRNVLGAVSQFNRASIVGTLAAARKRKRAATGRCEGRKPIAITHPEATSLARQLRRKRKANLSLRAISAELAQQGFLNERGRPYNPKTIGAMIK
jgi:DNA invertase Pin-like site-specific DNA recombinase